MRLTNRTTHTLVAIEVWDASTRRPRALLKTLPSPATATAAGLWAVHKSLAGLRSCLDCRALAAAGLSALVCAAGPPAAGAAGEISGVVTATGRALSGYCVAIDKLNDPHKFHRFETISGPGGYFLRGGLPSGIYGLEGCRSDSRSRYVIWGQGRNAVDLRNAGHQVANLNLVLGGAVSGTVTDAATGRPATGNICVEDKPRNHVAYSYQIKNGRFLVAQLAPEPTRFAVVAGCGVSKDRFEYATTFWPTDGLRVAEATSYKLMPGKTINLPTLALRRTGAIAGRITRAGSGAAIAHICVEANSEIGSTAPFGGLSETPTGREVGVFTDSTGAYELPNVPPGPYSIRLSANVNAFYKPKEPVRSCGAPYLALSALGAGAVPTELTVNSAEVTEGIDFEAPAGWGGS
jgi:hypothetical protein